MKDLSRVEKLEQQIYRMAEEYGERKWKRIKRTFFVLTIVVYLIVLFNDGMNCVQDYLQWILAAPFAAGMIMFVSYAVWYYCISNSLEEEKAIAKKIGELEAIKFSKYE